MSTHIFVDESKHRGYCLAASIQRADELKQLRELVRGLVLPGQRRLHMTKESPSRRRRIVDAICDSKARAVVYDAARRYACELDSRAACLRALVDDQAGGGTTVLAFEQDDSLLGWDRRQLYALVGASGSGVLRYTHFRASAEPLLAIPDIVAFCWAKGGDWRRRIQPVVTAVLPV
ncbi:MAG: hypothetical protein FWD74_09770 [Actinomycetia bacterium]|nr:hypothetical protein [Actinomycetes bacterium]